MITVSDNLFSEANGFTRLNKVVFDFYTIDNGKF